MKYSDYWLMLKMKMKMKSSDCAKTWKEMTKEMNCLLFEDVSV